MLHLHDLLDVLVERLKRDKLLKFYDGDRGLLPLWPRVSSLYPHPSAAFGDLVDDVQLPGLHVDRKGLEAAIQEKDAALTHHTKRLLKLLKTPGINLNSWMQVLKAFRNLDIELSNVQRETLEDRAGFTLEEIENEVPKALEGMKAHPELAAYMQFKSLTKELQYMKKYDELSRKTGRIHGVLKGEPLRSGRMSSQNPSLQQVPRSMRHLFVAPKGEVMVVVDLNQVELRVMAVVARDSAMIKAFREGKDLHLMTAMSMMGKDDPEEARPMRKAAKAVNFGMLFGMGAEGLQDYAKKKYGVEMTLYEASRYRNQILKQFYGVRDFLKRLRQERKRVAYSLQGRRKYIPERGIVTEGANQPVQGTCADALRESLAVLSKRLPEGARIGAAVHDELLVFCKPEQAEAVLEHTKQALIEPLQALSDEVPFEAEGGFGPSWAKAKPG